MRRVLTVALCTAVFLGAAVGMVRSAPQKGRSLSVRSLKARLMRSPRFFGPAVTELKRGVKVTFIQKKGSWYLVQAGGKRGWVHKNRVSKKSLKLKSGSTGGGTNRGEAELAGRGFNPTVERRFQNQNAKLDFTHVDKIQKAEVESESVANFMAEGGIRMRAGGKK